MRILVLNCGSSSVKYQFINTDTGSALAKGTVQRIAMAGASITHKPTGKDTVVIESELLDHTAAIDLVVKTLSHSDHGVISSMDEIDAVGHRIAHGGETFTDSALVTPSMMTVLHDCIELAPLHMPAMIRGIKACQRVLSDQPHVSVFDTSFHHTLPAQAYVYPLPYIFYDEYRIRRYGFHGTSHKYVAQRAALLTGKPFDQSRIITCHLGNGASITAIKDGQSIDTSMGFTPLEGLMMGTRSGDVDPAIILYIMDKEELSRREGNSLMNKHSGLAGVSGISADMRDVVEAMESGNERAKLAFDIYCYRLTKYIGSYAAALGGLDILVFTAGVGENSPQARTRVCSTLGFLGVELDESLNQKTRAVEAEISSAAATVPTCVIPTNEELVIAQETERVVNSEQPQTAVR